LTSTGLEPPSGFAAIFDPSNSANFDNLFFFNDGVFGLALPNEYPGLFKFNLQSSPGLFTSNFDWGVAIEVAAVPEPSGVLLFGAGMLVVGRAVRRRAA
jgi:hypothetical protein